MDDIEVNAVIDSPYDERDYTLDMLVYSGNTLLPSSYKTQTTVSVLNQGSVACCVACALASCRYIQEELQEGVASKFSVNYIYGNRLPTDSQNEGMIPRQALKTILDYGDCHWSDFSGYSVYETAKAMYAENKVLYDDLAYPYKINSYYRLYSVNEIKTAVYELGCVVISYDLTANFRHPNAEGYVEYDDTQEIAGKHMVTIIGWTEDEHWIVLNSWGTDYGDKGYCYISFDYPYNEAWTMVDNNRYKELFARKEIEKSKATILGIKSNRYLC